MPGGVFCFILIINKLIERHKQSKTGTIPENPSWRRARQMQRKARLRRKAYSASPEKLLPVSQSPSPILMPEEDFFTVTVQLCFFPDSKVNPLRRV